MSTQTVERPYDLRRSRRERVGNEIVTTVRVRAGATLLHPTTARAGRVRVGLVAAIRCAIGIGALARPSSAVRASGVDRVTAERVAWLGQLVGARDLALGVGLLRALARREDTRDWVRAGVFADAVDALALGTAAARGAISPLAGAAAVAAAVSGVLAGVPIAVRRTRGARGDVMSDGGGTVNG
jgi:peptide-methionine (R)-S-oxide reductase